MLKTTDQSKVLPTPDDERPVGDLVHELVEDGKAYAKAEIGVAKAIAVAKANALKLPVILFGAAFLLINAAIVVLGVAGLLGLAPMIGPVLGGIVVFLVFAGIAGGLAWYGARRFQQDL